MGKRVEEPTTALRSPEARGDVPTDARIADYAIRARLDTAEHTIAGSERITWRNRTEHPTDRLEFHLYMNGFRAEDTAWMREGRGSHRGQAQSREHPWGYCNVTSAKLADGTDLKWSEGEDPTVMTMALPEPVEPGAAVDVDLEFETLLPRVFARTGFADDFYMVGQWFPKVAVLGKDGRWHNHVFSFHSEFFADFGNYEVHLDVPKRFVVGATGILATEDVEDDRKLLTYRAEMVHDFAWTASPDFVETFGEVDGIRIRQLMPPQDVPDAPAHLEAQRATLESMQRRFGPYPWSTITIVHPPPGAGGAGGMEYPTLYTTSRRERIPAIVRRYFIDERLSGVLTTVHEFGHQYFQGMLASNEASQPWMDEGMNTTSNGLAILDRWGQDPWLIKVAGVPFYGSDFVRLGRRRNQGLQPIDQPADAFSPLIGAYSPAVYGRTAALMLTLRNIVGEAPFDKALRAYADRFRFRHPTGADLESVLVEILGAHVPVGRAHPDLPDTGAVSLDLRRYLDQGLRSAATVGFRVHRVLNRRLPGEAGYHRDEAGDLVGGDRPDFTAVADLPDERVEGVAVVQRTGEFQIPVEIEIVFDGGDTTRRIWDGRDRYTIMHFPGQRVRRVGIDPDGRLLLEAVRNDNHRYAPGVAPEIRVDARLGGIVEAAALALLGGLGP